MKTLKKLVVTVVFVYMLIWAYSGIGAVVADPHSPEAYDYLQEKAMQDSHKCTDITHTYCDGGDSTGRYICECDGLGCK